MEKTILGRAAQTDLQAQFKLTASGAQSAGSLHEGGGDSR